MLRESLDTLLLHIGVLIVLSDTQWVKLNVRTQISLYHVKQVARIIREIQKAALTKHVRKASPYSSSSSVANVVQAARPRLGVPDCAFLTARPELRVTDEYTAYSAPSQTLIFIGIQRCLGFD